MPFEKGCAFITRGLTEDFRLQSPPLRGFRGGGGGRGALDPGAPTILLLVAHQLCREYQGVTSKAAHLAALRSLELDLSPRSVACGLFGRFAISHYGDNSAAGPRGLKSIVTEA